MANIKSAIKRAKKAAVRTLRNRAVKSTVRTAVRRVQTQGAEALAQAFSVIDRAVSKGVLHKNTAARKKARLAKAAANQAQGA